MGLAKDYDAARRAWREAGFAGLAAALRGRIETIARKRRLRRELGEIRRKDSLQDKFSKIYAGQFWQDDKYQGVETRTGKGIDSVSGSGSSSWYTPIYVEELRRFLSGPAREIVGTDGDIRIFDAPCGDMQWIEPIAFAPGIRYSGGDIVPDLMAALQRKYAGRDVDLLVFDITADTFVEADIWHVRDCHIHLSFDNIVRSLENFAASTVPYVLMTTYPTEDGFTNKDIFDGNFRRLDFRKAPFGFDAPILALRDYPDDMGFPPRHMALYSREMIRTYLDRMKRG